MKGATLVFATKSVTNSVSTRAPVKGATCGSLKADLTLKDSFNSRSREGSDVCVGDLIDRGSKFQLALP